MGAADNKDVSAQENAEKRKMWGDKPYHSLNYALRERFGAKVYKLSVDIGCTCPNRDGTIGSGGCIFCLEGGNADFAEKSEKAERSERAGRSESAGKSDAAGGSSCRRISSVDDVCAQLERAKARVEKKMTGEQSSAKYIAYFQTFTNTYGDIEKIGSCFKAAAELPYIVGLSVGTRPDCLGNEWIELLSELNRVKPVSVELGLQTVNEETAKIIRRGYELAVFEDAFGRLKNAGLEVVVHMILGLPGENVENIRSGVEYLTHLQPHPDGIKLQLMHVLKGTDLAEMYESDPEVIHSFGLEEYTDMVIDLVEMLPPDMVVHRLTGDGSKRSLVAPLWSADKKKVLNTLSRRFKERGSFQGMKYE